MHDGTWNHLKTGALSVAPGQIMDPGIMKLRREPDHLSRLKADTGLDALEAELDAASPPGWSFRQLLERLGGLRSARDLRRPDLSEPERLPPHPRASLSA